MKDLTGLFALATLLGIYFLPIIIAGARSHHNQGPIFIINLFLGWTFIGWVIALAMAASTIRKVENRHA